MIDDIVEMVLKEARGRIGSDLPGKINSVSNEVTIKLMDIMDIFRDEERRKKEYENKG